MVASDMVSEIILLTGDVEALHLSDMLRVYNSAVNIVHVRTTDQLSRACSVELSDGKARRLILSQTD